MANLRGKKIATDTFPMLVEMNPKRVQKDNEGNIVSRYLDVQLDQSMRNPDKVKSGEVQVDSNPHLVSNKVAGKDGNEYVSHTMRYSESQYQKMVEGAGKKNTTLENGNQVLGITGSVQYNANKEFFVNTKKPIEPNKGNIHFGKNVMDKQAAVTAAATEVRLASSEADKAKDETGLTAPEAETPAVDTPEV